MSLPNLLPSCKLDRATVDCTCSALVCVPDGGLKSLPLVRIPSRRVSWRCSQRKRALGQCLRISACAAPPCERLGVSSTPAEKVRFTGLDFNPSALQSFEGLVFQEARSLELIHAAAYLRALSFHTYPEGRSEESLKVCHSFVTMLSDFLEFWCCSWNCSVGLWTKVISTFHAPDHFVLQKH